MVTKSIIERVLQTYSWEEILEYNDLEEMDVIEYCITMGYIQIPDPKPIDLETEDV